MKHFLSPYTWVNSSVSLLCKTHHRHSAEHCILDNWVEELIEEGLEIKFYKSSNVLSLLRRLCLKDLFIIVIHTPGRRQDNFLSIPLAISISFYKSYVAELPFLKYVVCFLLRYFPTGMDYEVKSAYKHSLPPPMLQNKMEE